MSQEQKKPKLVIGIVIDQMRNDYIYRYSNRFGNNGFNKLIAEGFYCENTHYNYVPTYTGPGHASIYTGTTPKYHGIIGNDWYVRLEGKNTYCVSNENYKTVGAKGKSGKKSPINLKATTIGDELKLSTVGKSKVFSISLKDRSAILPGGHMPDGAFWMSDTIGYFCTSDFYGEKLPEWLVEYNKSGTIEKYLKQGWNTYYPISSYTNSIADKNNYEASIQEDDKCEFPYDFKNEIKEKNFEIVKYTPFGNTVITDLAMKCVEKENLGKDDISDMLLLSYSTPDLIGHTYGPRSIEIEDIYIRLDLEIEKLLKHLESTIGKDNYVLFITADHGGADISNHLKDNKVPSGLLDDKVVYKILSSYFKENNINEDLLLAVTNNQVYLNNSKLTFNERQKLELQIIEVLKGINGIADAFASSLLVSISNSEFTPLNLVANGYNSKLSGNVAFIMEPGWMDYHDKGTTHGSCYPYDTHVPLIFYGSGIKKGSIKRRVLITQIAPTISALLKINYPNACFYEPILELFKD
ncbi:MAG: alkaline phosphatase PafA [Bacteroidia bacterium]